jgi:3-oxoacyl-[acyl-carrier protein] reductase
MQIEGKAAVVTGSSTGVGRATAIALARGGCHVLINYSKSRSEAEKTAAEAEKLGVNTALVQADVADDDACRAMIGEAVRALGRLDILVNNAGTTRFIAHDDLEAVSGEAWDRIFAVNVRGTFQCTRAAKGPMLEAGGGDVVNVSSVAARLGKGSSIPYAASKAAIDNLTIALGRALAPHIRVNAVAPGFIDGRWLKDGLGEMYEPLKQSFEKRLPLGRVLQPEDVAATILGVITGSDLMTGQSIVCDAGMMIAKWNT